MGDENETLHKTWCREQKWIPGIKSTSPGWSRHS